MSDKPKAWIVTLERRPPKRGDLWLRAHDGSNLPEPGPRHDQKFLDFRVVESDNEGLVFGASENYFGVPIPSEIVMVPKRLLIGLRKLIDTSGHFVWPSTWPECLCAILACAEPAKPKDEILEAMNEAEKALWLWAGVKGQPTRDQLLLAMKARERELEARS